MKLLGQTQKNYPTNWKYQVLVWIDGKGPYAWSRHVKLGQAREAARDRRIRRGVEAKIKMRMKRR